MPFRPSPLLHDARPVVHGAAGHAALTERTQRVAALMLRAPVAHLSLPAPGHAAASSAPGHRPAEPASADGAATPSAALLAEVASRGAPLVVADAAAVVVPALAEALRAQAWQAFAAVPVHGADGRVQGVLAVADVTPRAWREEELLLLADLAALAAAAIGTASHEQHRWVREVAQREAQEARRKSERWLALAFHSSADLIFLMAVEPDGHYRCAAVNDAWLAVTGLDEAGVVGRRLEEFLPPAAAARTAARYAAVADAGEPLHYEECLQLPVGTLHVETLLTPITDEAGHCTYLLGVARDVSARKRDEAELRTAKEEAEAARRDAERASQAKTDFLARMSHELRTPLNSVIGFANILRGNRHGHLSERELSFVERIASNGQHLLSLISDLLDIARVEAGRMPLSIGAVPLGPLVRTTAALFEPQIGERPVTLRVEVPERLERLETDATRLQQVLVNLVANALRFTPRGSVTVRVVADEATGRPLRIEVEDTGVGIPAACRDSIFEAFAQADPTPGIPAGGSGLGLAISRSLCHLMGYTLGVRSVTGEGSTFTVELDGLRAPASASRALHAAH